MYQRILLGYDGTTEGRNALKEGADIALSMHAETHLLAIIQAMKGATVPEAFSETLFAGEERGAHGILADGVQWLRERGLEAQGHIAYGNAVDHIVETARSIDADLIVVAHKPRSRLARWWSDSEQATLLERAPCSILVTVLPAP